MYTHFIYVGDGSDDTHTAYESHEPHDVWRESGLGHNIFRIGRFKSDRRVSAIDSSHDSLSIRSLLKFLLVFVNCFQKNILVYGIVWIIGYNEILIDTYEYTQSILDVMFGLDLTVICEPGRFIVGNSGVFVTKVLYEKVNGNKRFIIVDGAMNDLIRPALYNAYHRIEVLNDNKEFSDCNLVGPVCESGDFFAKNIELPKTNHNDLIAIYSAGAYGFTMASNYNTRGRVAEIAVENGVDRLIRKRETFEDLIALEEEFIK